MSPRWALAHVKLLPLGSAFVAQTRGGQQFRGWDEDRYALVALINAVRALHYIFALAHSDPKKAKPKPPDPYPIPDKVTRKKAAPQPGSFAFIAGRQLAAAKEKRKAAAHG
jgi:hypothetical protein